MPDSPPPADPAEAADPVDPLDPVEDLTLSRDPGPALVVTGTVHHDPELRRTTLTATDGSGRSWTLVGTTPLPPADGTEVTVAGHLDPAAATTAQVGPVLVVAEVRPATGRG